MNSTKVNLTLLLLFLLSFHVRGQSEHYAEKRTWKKYVGVAIHHYDLQISNMKSIEYGIKLNKRNEIASTGYFAWQNKTNYLYFSSSFHWSLIKKEKRRFNLFLAPELFLGHKWNHSNQNQRNSSDYYSALFIGLIPQYRICKRFEIAMEIKIGYGFVWYKFDGYFYHGNYIQSYGERTFFALPGLRLKYNFGKK
jgi:hypothetical protein